MTASVNSSNAYIIVTGNEKGGCGKTTITMHLAASLLYEGMKVATIDLDARQRSLSRYVENRLKHAEDLQKELPQLSHFIINKSDLPNRDEAEADERNRFEKCLTKATEENDVVIVDAPGNDTYLSRLAHSYADTIITPINDSFIDLDVLAHIKEDTLDMSRPGVYSEIVWQAKMQRAKRDKGEIDWVVLRNRLSNLDAHNKRQMSDALDKLSRKTGCRIAQGLSERVIYRELFLKGLTLLDIMDEQSQVKIRMTHIAARQELRELVHFLDLNFRIRQKTGDEEVMTGDGGGPKQQDEELSHEEMPQQETALEEEVEEETEPKKPLPENKEEEVNEQQDVILEQAPAPQASEGEAAEEGSSSERHHYSLEELSQMEAEIEAREGVVDSLESLESLTKSSVFDLDEKSTEADTSMEDAPVDESVFDAVADVGAAGDESLAPDVMEVEAELDPQQTETPAPQTEQAASVPENPGQAPSEENGLSEEKKARLNEMLAASKRMINDVEVDSSPEKVSENETISPDNSSAQEPSSDETSHQPPNS